jgi:hypothetical protein
MQQAAFARPRPHKQHTGSRQGIRLAAYEHLPLLQEPTQHCELLVHGSALGRQHAGFEYEYVRVHFIELVEHLSVHDE